MAINLKKTVRNNIASVGVLLGISMALTTILPARALFKADSDRTVTVAQTEIVPAPESQPTPTLEPQPTPTPEIPAPEQPTPASETPTPEPQPTPTPETPTPDNSQQLPEGIVTPPPGAAANSDDVKQILEQEELSPDIGEIKEMEGCSKSLFGGWGKGRQEDQCKWELPKPLEDQGWVIIGSKVNVKSKVGKDHRSGYGTSFTGSNSAFSYISSTLDKLQREINVALSKGDTKLAADLKAKYEAVRNSSLESSSSHNTAILQIWTQSGAVTRAGIDATVTVKLVKIR